MASGDDKRPISTVLIFAAMDSEALLIVEHFKLSPDDGSLYPLGVPWIRYHGYYKDLNINVIYPWKDRDLGINSVALCFVKGASIFDVFLVSDLAFHDRRIPIPGPDKYGVGRRQSFSTPNLVKELNLKKKKFVTCPPEIL
ncbi:hypothetical protein L1987_86607 [Smallanthus sonchifolius]|uniref:Uncharacterized protein n=1 Tax=Smallanthus sonchifolius TaxID=185202 RepID=A0ACB8Y108_9ASTR|nr:hypothetical protein L1987_86607 [Smallanthus sonchifolius]